MPDSFTLMGYEWNVTAAKAAVADRRPNGRLYLADVEHWIGFVVINTKHAKTVNVEDPIIVIRRAFGSARAIYQLPIDGWHRIYRARQTGLASLPMHLLSAAEEKRIRL